MTIEQVGDNPEPESRKIPKRIRHLMQLSSGFIPEPIIGGLIAYLAGAWSEKEQEKECKYINQWLKMLQDEIREKEITLNEILARLDLQDERIARRIEGQEYQSLVKKTFREWSGAESDEKRKCI